MRHRHEWTPPKMTDCPACSGTGRWNGIYHSGPCAACTGSGMVLADGQGPVPADEMVVILRSALDQSKSKLQRLLAVPGVQTAIDADNERRRQEAIYPAGRPAMD